MTKQMAFAAMLLAALLTLSACGGRKQETNVTSTTVGQELTDLQEALDSGVITESEFEKKKRDILRRK